MPASDRNGPGAEIQLSSNVELRIPQALTHSDNTGDDLNLIAMSTDAALTALPIAQPGPITNTLPTGTT